MDQLEQMQSMMQGGMKLHEPETNLWSIILNAVFGFLLGVILIFGLREVIDYGTKLAQQALKLSGYGQEFAAMGISTAAPYVVLAPIGATVVKQLSSVRSLKSFGYFVASALAGLAIAFVMKGYLSTLIK